MAPDLVVGPHADPLGNLAVLLGLLGKGLLRLEGLVRRLKGGGDGRSVAESATSQAHLAHTEFRPVPQ